MKLAAARTEAWSRYWATGALHSCAGSFDGNYGGVIGEWWRQVFDALPLGAQVLDLACGNGPLAQLLLSRRDDPGLCCHAVDLAPLCPPWAAQEPRVRFRGSTSIEDLPFGIASFDLVISQYGLEYAALEAAVAEAVRVTRPGGRLCFVMHHADSRPVTLAIEERIHIDWLLGRSGWFPAAQAMLLPMSLAGSPEGAALLGSDPQMDAVRRQFDACLEALRARADTSACPDLLLDLHRWTAQAFQVSAHQGVQAGRRSLDEIRTLVADIDTRLGDLLEHALDPAEIQALMELLASHGVRASLRPLHDHGQLMGWGVDGRRAA